MSRPAIKLALFLHLVFTAGTGWATSYTKAYNRLMHNVVEVYILHERRGGDATKATAEDLFQPPFRVERLDTFYGQFTYRQRVFLFTPNPPKHPTTGHWLLATLSGSVEDELKNPSVGRTALWKPPGGDIYGTWESEEFMQDIAKRHHITLPTLPLWPQPGRPPGRPTTRLVDYVIEFPTMNWLGRTVVLSVVAVSFGLLYFGFRMLRRMRRRSISRT